MGLDVCDRQHSYVPAIPTDSAGDNRRGRRVNLGTGVVENDWNFAEVVMGGFNRDIYFDIVRDSLFGGSLTQQQVDGQNFILEVWATKAATYDLRWLAYALATTFHETAQTMWPIEEYGKGAGQSYGKVDPETGQAYYGRGFVQLTWRDNYARADRELGFSGDQSCEWHAENALDPKTAAAIMFRGMAFGWFRPPNQLDVFFNETVDDPYGAREIINGDKHYVPEWGGGKNVGNIIKGYYELFKYATNESWSDFIRPPMPPKPTGLVVRVIAPPGVTIIVESDVGTD